MERLLRNTRREKIHSLINERGHMRVVDVAALLGVTDETVRGDLKALAKEGKVIKVHGGAESPNKEEVPFVLPAYEKPEFARKVLEMIGDGDMIYLDGSFEAQTVAQMIPDIPITVYTNSPQVMNSLVRRSKIKLVGLGGKYDPKARAFLGDQTKSALGRSLFDWAVFSCDAVCLSHGLLEGDEAKAIFLEEVLKRSQKKLVLTTKEKLGVRGKYNVWNNPEDVYIITDAGRNSPAVDSFNAQGYEVIVVSDHQ